jgi:hypothetical protein
MAGLKPRDFGATGVSFWLLNRLHGLSAITELGTLIGTNFR